MKLNRINPFTNLPFNVNLNVSKQQINIFEANDESIQKIFANLNSDEREYILSGIPMGLFEIQFEKYFVVYFSLPFRKERYEIYFAKSLKNFYVYKLIDDVFDSLEIFKWEFINGFVKLEENKVETIETIILFHINYEINNNVEFVNFCKKSKMKMN